MLEQAEKAAQETGEADRTVECLQDVRLSKGNDLERCAETDR